MYSTYVSYSRTFAQSNRETTVSFQDAYSNSKTVVGVVFHKFPADSGLRRVPVGKAYMCACMKQLSGKGGSWTSNTNGSSLGPVIEAVAGTVTGATIQHHKRGQQKRT